MFDGSSDGAGIVFGDEIRKQGVAAVDGAMASKGTQLAAHAAAISRTAAGEDESSKREETDCAADVWAHETGRTLEE